MTASVLSCTRRGIQIRIQKKKKKKNMFIPPGFTEPSPQPPRRDERRHPGLRLKEMVDRDKIREEANHRRGCGSMQYADCCPWAMFSTHKPIRMTGETKRTFVVGTRHLLHLGRLFRWIEGKR
jgi:hypothetical protein